MILQQFSDLCAEQWIVSRVFATPAVTVEAVRLPQCVDTLLSRLKNIDIRNQNLRVFWDLGESPDDDTFVVLEIVVSCIRLAGVVHPGGFKAEIPKLIVAIGHTVILEFGHNFTSFVGFLLVQLFVECLSVLG